MDTARTPTIPEASAPSADDVRPIPPLPVSLKDQVVSAGLWAVGATWLAAGMGACMAARAVFTTDEVDWMDRVYIRGQLALTGSRWKAVVHPDVRADTQYFFFQNHVNHFDHCSMYNATPHFKQGIELAEHFAYPVYGPFMKQRGTIPVVRGSKEGMRNLVTGIREEVARGHSILAFPEGTRTVDGRVGPFKPGLFRVAMEVGAPIVPVAVTGMWDVMRKGSLLIRPGRDVTVYYEQPVPTAGLTEADLPDLVQTVRQAIVRRVDDDFRAQGRL